ncbi:para-nitrobenzyl esterase [Amycolatopsis rubida]|uniref:Carboxylic ester hydrolase n=1 Tax=Amycolatopsis rubida TaxID=112413 RepID=A0A1I5HSP5_9PSEU|nr:para-nitrobenzyl esterase [Amycolatopsis rubida]
MFVEAETERPVAQTAHGRVRGGTEGTLAVFRGIPFAAAPVGELRFAAPQPPRSWENVLDAEDFGPIPAQAEVPSSAVAPPPNPFDDGRGCLTANVWTAELSGNRPVMVWIYGGGYLAGSAADPGYDGAVLAEEGVVVVTFNYRVGVEGFGQLAGAPANRGLLDQVAALEWVRDNVAAFGGDPRQVTVFGQSAGAGGVAALLAMPSAAGLFRRAIAQSVPGTFVSPELAADVMATIAASAGTTATVEGLRDLSLVAAVDALDLREHADRWGAFAYGVTPFSPVVDGDVLPATPWQALRDGASRDVELIVGHTRDEFRKMLAGRGLLGRVTEEMTADALVALAPEGYRAAFPEATPEQLYETLHSDWLFRMPSANLAREHTGRSYLYEFVLEAPGSGGVLGACHGVDVALTFGNLTGPLAEKMLGPPPPNAELAALSAAMRAAWTGFARGEGPGWGEFDAAGTTWVIGADPIVRSYPEQLSANLWAGHDFPCLPLRSPASGRERTTS